MPPPFSTRLLAWYDAHRRALPWRAKPGETAEPYAVWLSEIMLQQTTVAAAAPYYRRFLERWPDVAALAAAPAEEVMQAWAGLGYYARARNLLACARHVARELDGRFPGTEDGLRALPGIGPYTAAAIAAIAFGRRAVVVDGNVERVVSRRFAIETPIPAARPEIRSRADSVTPKKRAGDFAQAMMDLGATICTPKNPACILCPVNEDCAARVTESADAYPRRAPKKEMPLKAGVAFVATRGDGAVLMRTRGDKGMLGGMSEFPCAWSADFTSGAELDHAPFASEWRHEGSITHGFTHFNLTLAVYCARGIREADILKGNAAMRWVGPDRLALEALPTLMLKVAERAGLPVSRRSAVNPGAPENADELAAASRSRPDPAKERLQKARSEPGT